MSGYAFIYTDFRLKQTLMDHLCGLYDAPLQLNLNNITVAVKLDSCTFYIKIQI